MSESTDLTRLLIPDLGAADEQMFTDEQIDSLVTRYGGNEGRAAARALEIIAVDQVLLLKYVKTDDLTVDGSKVAETLLRLAKQLRDEADADDAAESNDAFDIYFPYAGPCKPELEARPLWY